MVGIQVHTSIDVWERSMLFYASRWAAEARGTAKGSGIEFQGTLDMLISALNDKKRKTAAKERGD